MRDARALDLTWSVHSSFTRPAPRGPGRGALVTGDVHQAVGAGAPAHAGVVGLRRSLDEQLLATAADVEQLPHGGVGVRQGQRIGLQLRQRDLLELRQRMVAAHHRHGGHALEREREEDQQPDGGSGREMRPEHLLQLERRLALVLHAVDGAERADDDFARGKGGDETDADAPVEAERRDGRLDHLADAAQRAVVDVRSLAADA